MMKKLLILLLTATAFAQNPQTSTAPIFSVNSRYVQGAGIGYWPTPGTGLVLNIAAGRSRCNNAMVSYVGGTLTLTDNATNYVYLDSGASCVPADNTTGYTSAFVNLATVVTSGGAIVSITDDRTFGISGSQQSIDVLCSGNVTSILQTAITALDVTGGTVRLSSGSCYITAAPTFTALPGSSGLNMASIRLTGEGSSVPFDSTPSVMGPGAATKLELRYVGSYGKILTLMYGKLEIDHINLQDLTDGTIPFIYTTYTTLDIHDVGFIGPNCSSTSIAQDAIVLGGTNPVIYTISPTSAFQGYPTRIEHNDFSCVRGISANTWANGVQVINNHWESTAGGSAAITITGPVGSIGGYDSGWAVTDNLVEMNYFTCGTSLQQTFGNTFKGNSWYDSATSYAHCLNTAATTTFIEDNYTGSNLLVNDTSGTNSNSWLSSIETQPSHLAMPIDGLLLANLISTTETIYPGASQGTNPVFKIFPTPSATAWNLSFFFPIAGRFEEYLQSPDLSAGVVLQAINGTAAVVESNSTSIPLYIGAGNADMVFLGGVNGIYLPGPIRVDGTINATGGIININGTSIPATVLGNTSANGTGAAYVELVLTGVTGTITGTVLSGTCDSGTASVTGAVVGHPVAVSSTTGAVVGAAFNLRASVTTTGTVTVYVCGTGTPASLAYNVTVF